MKRQLFALLVVAALMSWPLLIAQDHWWAFILATAAITVALPPVLGQRWQARAGLGMPPGHAVLTITAFAAVAAASQMLLQHDYAVAGLKVNAPGLDDQIGFLFQAFNEEIFFRALMIGLLFQFVPSVAIVSLGTAFLFTAAHFILYRYSNPMHLALSALALATLFLAGVAMNNLYLAFRHIGFSWALHAGWNVVWLPAAFYDAATGVQLREPQIFDRVLGSPAIMAAAGVTAALSFLLLARRHVVQAPDITGLP
jgi:membrane protease YdiL (CAAX protease family)